MQICVKDLGNSQESAMKLPEFATYGNPGLHLQKNGGIDQPYIYKWKTKKLKDRHFLQALKIVDNDEK